MAIVLSLFRFFSWVCRNVIQEQQREQGFHQNLRKHALSLHHRNYLNQKMNKFLARIYLWGLWPGSTQTKMQTSLFTVFSGMIDFLLRLRFPISTCSFKSCLVCAKHDQGLSRTCSSVQGMSHPSMATWSIKNLCQTCTTGTVPLFFPSSVERRWSYAWELHRNCIGCLCPESHDVVH